MYTVGPIKVVALLSFTITAGLMCSAATFMPVPEEKHAPGLLNTSAVESADIVKTINATGTLHASVNVEVGSQLSGQVAVLAADFNDVVKKGQMLLQLDQSKFQAQLDAAQAAFENAKADERIAEARLDRALIDIRNIEMQRRVLEARVKKAEIALEKAVRDMKRKSLLGERGAAPTAEVLDFTARLDVARAELQEAETVLDAHTTLVEGARADATRIAAELDGARASVKRLDAQLRNAAIDLDLTSIRSPIDGVVVGRSVTQGQTLASALEARTLFTIAGDLRNLDVYVRVDESDISKIVVGQSATFTVDSFPGREFKAVVAQIRKAPQVIQNVVNYTVVLAGDNSDYALLPGMTVLAKIITESTPAPLSVPLSALRFKHQSHYGSTPGRGGQATSVWVLKEDGKPVPVEVVVGEGDEKRAAIKSGAIQREDRVVVWDDTRRSARSDREPRGGRQ